MSSLVAGKCVDQYWLHRGYMQRLIQELGAQVVVELGTAMGRSTRIWAEALESTGGHLWTVDIIAPLDDWHLTYPMAHRITFIRGDSLKVRWYHVQPIDLLYVDDEHTYPHVLYELRRWVPWVRVGGRVLLDDVHAHDWAYTDHNAGWEITRAIQEFSREALLPWQTHPGGQGLAEITVTHPVAHRERVEHETIRALDFQRMWRQRPWWRQWRTA